MTAPTASPLYALFIYWHGIYLCLVRGKPYAALTAKYPHLMSSERLQIYWLWCAAANKHGTLKLILVMIFVHYSLLAACMYAFGTRRTTEAARGALTC